MKRITKDERGLVSITVTVILMLVISLTVLSFAQIIRREQREAVDNQLSSQAFYAAESGVNNTREFINAYIQSHPGASIPEKPNCTSSGDYAALPTDINTAEDVNVSCILVNSQPKSLTYDLSTTGGSKVVPLKPLNGATIDKLKLTWRPATQGNPANGCTLSNNLPDTSASSWPCGYGMIRIDLVPVSGALTRAGLMGSVFTAFMTPTQSGGSTSISYAASNINGGGAAQAIRPGAVCTNTNCTITVSGLSAKPGDYYARVSTLYRDASLTFSATTASNADVKFKDAQVVIDSTGRAQDVLRRIQVRVPLYATGLHADYAVTSNDSMCKSFVAFPGDSLTTGCGNGGTLSFTSPVGGGGGGGPVGDDPDPDPGSGGGGGGGLLCVLLPILGMCRQ